MERTGPGGRIRCDHCGRDVDLRCFVQVVVTIDYRNVEAKHASPPRKGGFHLCWACANPVVTLTLLPSDEAPA